jgi:hypothetical protein
MTETDEVPIPFDGAITEYYKSAAPEAVRRAIKDAKGHSVMEPPYPYRKQMKKSAYNDQMEAAADRTGQAAALGRQHRDAGWWCCSKGAMPPARVERSPACAPTSTRGWCAPWRWPSRPTARPASGISSAMSRNCRPRARSCCSTVRGTTARWSNMVFGFCTPEERAQFFRQVTDFEMMLIDEGMTLTKLWLDVGRAEQLRRFLKRERDPLKRWKLSAVDVEGLKRWDAYTEAIVETFTRTHTPIAPWTVLRSDCKKRARIAAIQKILNGYPYDGRDPVALGQTDPEIIGAPDILNV